MNNTTINWTQAARPIEMTPLGPNSEPPPSIGPARDPRKGDTVTDAEGNVRTLDRDDFSDPVGR